MLTILHVKFLDKILAKKMCVCVCVCVCVPYSVTTGFAAEMQGWINIQIQSDNPSYTQATEEKSYDLIS